MKRILFAGCLLLTSACNLGVPSPTAESAPKATLPSTPIPTATTQAAAPTESASATPEPPPFYFTDEFDAAPPYWEFFQTGGIDAPMALFDSGTLRIDISSADTWSIGIHNANTYLDVFVSTKASILPSGSVGLVCRYDETVGWYEFNAANDGNYSVLFGQWLAEGIAQYKPIVTDFSGHLTSPDYTIGLHCEENFLHLHVNDTLIRNLDVTNYGLDAGNIGITASSFGEIPARATFEWIKVSEP